MCRSMSGNGPLRQPDKQVERIENKVGRAAKARPGALQLVCNPAVRS